jgi:hypothetical protein
MVAVFGRSVEFVEVIVELGDNDEFEGMEEVEFDRRVVFVATVLLSGIVEFGRIVELVTTTVEFPRSVELLPSSVEFPRVVVEFESVVVFPAIVEIPPSKVEFPSVVELPRMVELDRVEFPPPRIGTVVFGSRVELLIEVVLTRLEELPASVVFPSEVEFPRTVVEFPTRVEFPAIVVFPARVVFVAIVELVEIVPARVVLVAEELNGGEVREP